LVLLQQADENDRPLAGRAAESLHRRGNVEVANLHHGGDVYVLQLIDGHDAAVVDRRVHLARFFVTVAVLSALGQELRSQRTNDIENTLRFQRRIGELALGDEVTVARDRRLGGSHAVDATCWRMPASARKQERDNWNELSRHFGLDGWVYRIGRQYNPPVKA